MFGIRSGINLIEKRPKATVSGLRAFSVIIVIGSLEMGRCSVSPQDSRLSWKPHALF